MQISELFKKTIEETFYDKTVIIYEAVEQTSEELDVITTKSTQKEELQCNVHQIANKVIQRDYGLNIEADIMVTCTKTTAQKGEILEHDNQIYSITEILTLDSHTKIFAKVGVSNG